MSRIASLARCSRWLRRTPELSVALSLAVSVFAISAFAGSVGDSGPQHQHLGGEYGNIARALAEGRGFSDPFGERTGPTSWMPPLMPLLLALLFLAFKSKAAVGAALTIVDDVALVAVGTILYSIMRRSAVRLSPLVGSAVYLLWLCVFYYYYFLLTHDVCLIMLLIAVLTLEAFRYCTTRVVSAPRWGVLLGVTALLSPAAALMWSVGIALIFVRERPSWRRGVEVIALASALAFPWVARNAAVFHVFVPVKSNLFYDLYMGNYVDDDGVWDNESMRLHPYVAPDERFKYAKLGEAGYIATFRHRFEQGVERNPRRFARNVAHRALVATVWYEPTDRAEEWPIELVAKRVMQPLLFCGLLLAVLLAGPNRFLSRLLAAMWAAYLLPYIAVAFYVRYLLPGAPVLVLLSFMGVDRIAGRGYRGTTLATASPGDGTALGSG